MSIANVNAVVITGNLTRDPELRALPSGTSLCKLRVAVNSRRKDGQSGEWVDKPNYFDVIVWGARGEAAAEHLVKGSPVAVNGRLDWREYEVKDGGKRQVVEIVAEGVQFLGASKPSEEASASAEEPEATERLDLQAEVDAQAQAVADQLSELATLTREQLDSRARDLGVDNPERMANKAAVAAEIETALAEYGFGEGIEDEDISF